MDSGEVIPGLNEDWTFAGAKMFEWLAGLMMAMLVSSAFDRPGQQMPLLIIIWIGTTFGLAQLRKGFPDEERGVRNICMVSLGFSPPGIPNPAALQPRWSGAPMRALDSKLPICDLQLDQALDLPRETPV